MKACIKCKQEKILDDFHFYKKSKDGHNNTCKVCRQSSFKEYYSLNKEFVNQKNKNYYNENVEVIANLHKNYRIKNKTQIKLHDKNRDQRIGRRWKKSKYQAEKRKLIWEIDLDQFNSLSLLPCFYCADKLHNRKFSTSSALDRKDNSKGYNIENVLPCCSTCNYLRGDILSVEETIELVKLLLKLRNL